MVSPALFHSSCSSFHRPPAGPKKQDQGSHAAQLRMLRGQAGRQSCLQKIASTSSHTRQPPTKATTYETESHGPDCTVSFRDHQLSRVINSRTSTWMARGRAAEGSCGLCPSSPTLKTQFQPRGILPEH